VQDGNVHLAIYVQRNLKIWVNYNVRMANSGEINDEAIYTMK